MLDLTSAYLLCFRYFFFSSQGIQKPEDTLIALSFSCLDLDSHQQRRFYFLCNADYDEMSRGSFKGFLFM